MTEFNDVVDAGPTEGGQAVAGDNGGDSIVESSDVIAEPRDYVDPSAFADKYVRIKVDGEELEVPFTEALNGYQRQADYTRKTQELATQRNQLQFAQTLQQALETDPQGTLSVLSRHYGVAAANQMIADAQQGAPQEPEFDDPLERRVWEMDQRFQQIEQERASERLQKEISRLQSTYEDFNPQEVVQAALRFGTTDLEGVYKQIAFDRVVAKLHAQSQVGQIQQQQTEQIVDAKRGAAFVSGGASANGPTEGPAGRISSVADAWAAAKQQIGIS